MTQAVWEDDALIVGEGGRRQTIVGGENHGPFVKKNLVLGGVSFHAEALSFQFDDPALGLHLISDILCGADASSTISTSRPSLAESAGWPGA